MSRYFIFALVVFAILLYSIDGTIVAVGFPVIISYFHTSLIVAGWIISIYQLAMTASLPLVGKISDVLGRKSTFMACVGLFTLGSLLCSIAPSIELLILFRFIQALGGAGILPSATGIVADKFPESRQRAIGFFSSIFPLGWIIGPNLGGWLIVWLGWRSLFWINIPLGLLVLVASSLLLHSDVRKKEEIDYMGAALVGISLCALMGGLSLIGNSQTTQTWVIAGVLFCAAIVAMVSLARHEVRSRAPIIDIEVMRGKPFIAANIYNFLYGAGIIGIMSLIPAFAVYVYGMSTVASGFILTPRSIGMIVASFAASNFIMSWGYRWPMILGTFIIAVGFVLLSLEPSNVAIFGKSLNNLTMLALLMLFLGVGSGISNPAANNACIELMPQRVATITAIRAMFRQAGGALSLTVATLVLHLSGTIAQGFFIVFIGVAVILLASITVIFAMPARPTHYPKPQINE